MTPACSRRKIGPIVSVQMPGTSMPGFRRMRRPDASPARRWCISVLCAILAAAGVLGGCGDSKSTETVATVAGVGTISRAMLEHWITIEAILLYEEQPARPVPPGVVPDPPSYSACIAYLRSGGPKVPPGTSRLTAAQLKAKCAAEYESLKVLTLNILAGWEWTLGKGAELGIKVSNQEAQQRIETVKKNLFSTKKAFTDYLARTRETLADMLFRAKVQVVEVKTSQLLETAQRMLPKNLTAQQRQQALAALAKRVAPVQQWVKRTNCRKGYVASACRQYKGSLAPGLPN